MKPDLSTWPRTASVWETGAAQGLHIGAQIYVSLAGKTVLDAAWGEARAGVPMQSETLMVWLSSSKPFAAAALAQLVEKGRLHFDQPVTEIIPEFGQNGKGQITARHLLTHTAGFRSADAMWNELSWEENVQAACAAPLEADWPLGQRAAYHLSISWFVLGELVRRLDGRAFADYVRQEIFEPLGMKNCWFTLDAETYRAHGERIGLMYNTALHRHEPHCFWDTEIGYALCRPGSSGHGPMRELARFYEALMRGGERDGVRILRAESVAELIRPQRIGLYDETFQHIMDWGLGFIVNSRKEGAATMPYGYGRHASARTFGHSGAQSSSAFADPARQLVIAWVFNGMCGEPAHRARARALQNALYEDLALATP